MIIHRSIASKSARVSKGDGRRDVRKTFNSYFNAIDYSSSRM